MLVECHNKLCHTTFERGEHHQLYCSDTCRDAARYMRRKLHDTARMADPALLVDVPITVSMGLLGAVQAMQEEFSTYGPDAQRLFAAVMPEREPGV